MRVIEAIAYLLILAGILAFAFGEIEDFRSAPVLGLADWKPYARLAGLVMVGIGFPLAVIQAATRSDKTKALPKRPESLSDEVDELEVRVSRGRKAFTETAWAAHQLRLGQCLQMLHLRGEPAALGRALDAFNHALDVAPSQAGARERGDAHRGVAEVCLSIAKVHPEKADADLFTRALLSAQRAAEWYDTAGAQDAMDQVEALEAVALEQLELA